MINGRLIFIGANLDALHLNLWNPRCPQFVAQGTYDRVKAELEEAIIDIQDLPESPERNRYQEALYTFCLTFRAIKNEYLNTHPNTVYLQTVDIEILRFINSVNDIENVEHESESDDDSSEEFEPVQPQPPSLLKRIWLNFIGKFMNYITNHFAKPEGFAQKRFLLKAWFWVTKVIQLPLLIITDSVEMALRKSLQGLFYALRHPSLLTGANLDDDSDENVNLNKIQYGIKEIGLGFDQFIQNIFGIKNLIIRPANSSKALLLAIKHFVNKSTRDKWETIKESVKSRLRHIKAHPLRYIPELLTLILSIVLPVVMAPGSVVASSIEPIHKGLTGVTAILPKVIPQAFVPHAFMPGIIQAATTAGVSSMLDATVPGLAIIGEAIGVVGQNLSNKASKPLQKELSATLDLLKDNLRLCDENCDPELYTLIESEINKVENELIAFDPTLVRHNSPKQIKSSIKTLKTNLRLINPAKEPKLFQQLQLEIKALENKLEKTAHPQAIVVPWERIQTDTLSVNKRDVLFKPENNTLPTDVESTAGYQMTANFKLG